MLTIIVFIVAVVGAIIYDASQGSLSFMTILGGLLWGTMARLFLAFLGWAARKDALNHSWSRPIEDIEVFETSATHIHRYKATDNKQNKGTKEKKTTSSSIKSKTRNSNK